MFSNCLPDLVILEILDHLVLIEQIKLRRVSKQWKLLTDKKINENKELVLFHGQPITKSVYWDYNKKKANINRSLLINEKILSNINFINFITTLKIEKLLVRCGGIYFENNKVDEKLVTLLNHFKENLEHLQIDNFTYLNTISKLRTKLDFKKLKSFSFHSGLFWHPKMFESFENLEYLSVLDYSIFKLYDFKIFKKLKHLEFHQVQEINVTRETNLDLINFKFTNLETLYLTDYEFRFHEMPISLNFFPSLKELHIFDTWLERDPSDYNYIDHFLEEKKRLQKSALKIYFKGFEYTEELMQQSFIQRSLYEKGITEDFLHFFQNNQSTYKSVNQKRWRLNLTDSFISCLENMGDLKEEIIKNMTQCFLKEKFINLNEIQIIFENCSEIILYYKDQSNLDLLPKIFPNARRIVVYNKIENETGRINFSFISHFESMKDIILDDFKISIKSLDQIFKGCRYLCLYRSKGVSLEIQSGKVIFNKNYQSRWSADKEFKSIVEFLNYLSVKENSHRKSKCYYF